MRTNEALGQPQADESFVYICFHLQSDRLTRDCKGRLEARGVECLDEGGPHEAYGIVRLSSATLGILFADPEIAWVERREPPNCI